MTQNDIYKQVEIDTAQCVERRYSFFKFKPRRHYEPSCRAEAKARHQWELDLENAESEEIQDILDSKLMNGQIEIVITLIIALLILGVVYFYILK